MGKVNDLIAQRFKKGNSAKMSTLAELSSSGHLSSFSGVFRVTPLSEDEHNKLKDLLELFSEQEMNVHEDLKLLSALTSEVKAINNQAAILHGERIKKAQLLLKSYKEGAFTAWLLTTYGNRQTPYNFLQYYELYITLPQGLLPKLDLMPRQAVYTLASRKGSILQKEKIIEGYRGESKNEVLTLIRNTFPLSEKDKRGSSPISQCLQQLFRLRAALLAHAPRASEQERKEIKQLLKELQHEL